MPPMTDLTSHLSLIQVTQLPISSWQTTKIRRTKGIKNKNAAVDSWSGYTCSLGTAAYCSKDAVDVVSFDFM